MDALLWGRAINRCDTYNLVISLKDFIISHSCIFISDFFNQGADKTRPIGTDNTFVV